MTTVGVIEGRHLETAELQVHMAVMCNTIAQTSRVERDCKQGCTSSSHKAKHTTTTKTPVGKVIQWCAGTIVVLRSVRGRVQYSQWGVENIASWLKTPERVTNPRAGRVTAERGKNASNSALSSVVLRRGRGLYVQSVLAL
jgi:hypothetical protein